MWFQRRYVAAILSGEKTDTIRAMRARCPAAGAVVPASVGPVAPFAWLRIVATDVVRAADLDPERRADVETLLGVADAYRRIVFAVERVASP